MRKKQKTNRDINEMEVNGEWRWVEFDWSGKRAMIELEGGGSMCAMNQIIYTGKGTGITEDRTKMRHIAIRKFTGSCLSKVYEGHTTFT